MLYELTVRSTYFGQQIVNRWNYVSTGTPASVLGSFALLSAFGAVPSGIPAVYPNPSPFFNIYAGLSTAHIVNTAEARAASDYDVSDFYERPFVGGYAGAAVGEALSPINAYGFRSNRVRLDIGRATKRFAGVVEANVASGGEITGAGIISTQNMAVQMSHVLTYDDEGNTITFSPCVVSKQAYTTPSGKRAYKYYPTLAEQLAKTAVGVLWEPYTTVRSQVSRQYGRGN